MSSDTSKRDDTDKAPEDTGNQEQQLQEDANMNHQLVSTDYSVLYKCNYCGISFTDKSDMDVHLQTHSGSKVYECADCESTFNNVNEWLNHLNNHTEKHFTCSKCSAKISFLKRFVKHVKSHDYEKLYQCQYCEYKSRRLYTLKNHVITHKEDGNLKCDKCGKTFRRMYNLTNHLLLHSGENEFKCRRCHKKFQNRSDLKRHMNFEKGCKNIFINLSKHSEVSSASNPSFRWLSKNETSSGTVSSLGQGTSSHSGPDTICPPESMSAEGAHSTHDNQSLATKYSEVPELLAYSRTDIECLTEKIKTKCSIDSVPLSKKVEKIYCEEVMRFGPASPILNSNACATKSFSASGTLNQNQTSFATNEYIDKEQEDKNVPKGFHTTETSSSRGNYMIPELYSTPMTSERETELERRRIVDYSSILGTNTIRGISSETESPSYSELVEFFSLRSQSTLSPRLELSTPKVPSSPSTHFSFEPNLGTRLATKKFSPKATSSPSE